MEINMKKSISLCLILSFIMNIHVFAADNTVVNTTVGNVGMYLYETVPKPQAGSVGGEWAVMGMARSGLNIPNAYYENYYKTAENYVKEHNGILHDKKYTEYSRLTTALTAIGKDPTDVLGFNLLTPLGDYKKTIQQGINGSIWALIALDSGGYKMPVNTNAEIQATREMYINYILEHRTPDGGWAFSGSSADPDMTAMALQALAKYLNNDSVKAAADGALRCMSERQNENGGFSVQGTEISESCAQMLVALCEMGISYDDARFVKNGKTMLDNLMTYYVPQKGFKHTLDSTENQMATEQCFYALVSVKRMNDGENSLYRMNDAVFAAPVRKTEIIADITFGDVQNHASETAIKALSRRGIINGKSETLFEPDSTMTRAEFAAITARGLGLPQKEVLAFKDVTYADWFYNYVSSAYFYGIINGVSENEFNPNGTITHEEAAVMTARAAMLCGLDTSVTDEVNDYNGASEWARDSLAFCLQSGIISDNPMPQQAVTRAEIADMLYNMLSIAGLL